MPLELAEPFSAVSHLVAGIAWLALAPLVVLKARDDHHRLALAVYFTGVASMFLFSGTYHMLGREHSLGRVLWHLDHGSIWLALAASFTPIQVALAPERWYRRQLRGIWTLAVTGAVLELVLLERLPLWVSPLLYVGMGWACFGNLLLVRARAGAPGFLPLLAGGTLASIGGVMDSLDRPALWPGVFGPHDLMHVLIVAGGIAFLRFHILAADGRYTPARHRYRRAELQPSEG